MTLPDQSHPTSPAKAIRAYCLECCLESPTEVKLCTAEECPLWPFRFGKNPNIKGRQLSDEEKKRAAENLKRFKLEKSRRNAEENSADGSGSINPYPSMDYAETALSNGEYPAFGNFPEEDNHG